MSKRRRCHRSHWLCRAATTLAVAALTLITCSIAFIRLDDIEAQAKRLEQAPEELERLVPPVGRSESATGTAVTQADSAGISDQELDDLIEEIEREEMDGAASVTTTPSTQDSDLPTLPTDQPSATTETSNPRIRSLGQ